MGVFLHNTAFFAYLIEHLPLYCVKAATAMHNLTSIDTLIFLLPNFLSHDYFMLFSGNSMCLWKPIFTRGSLVNVELSMF